MNLLFMRCDKLKLVISLIIENKQTSVFHASVLLLTMNFDISLSN